MFLICGEALYDLFVEEEIPTGLRIDARIGGSPFNVAVGLARLGKTAALLTGVSTDALGDRLMAALEAEGVETRFLARMANPTTLAVVALGPAGEPRFTATAPPTVRSPAKMCRGCRTISPAFTSARSPWWWTPPRAPCSRLRSASAQPGSSRWI